MGRAVSAYFAFSNEHRAAVREELQASAEGDQKISVAVVAKGLGERWRALDDEGKARYQEIAQQQTKAAAQAAEAAEAEAAEARKRAIEQRDGSPDAGSPGSAPQQDGAEDGDAEAANGIEPAAKPASLPVSIVKRIMCFDPDVDRVSAGAVRTVSKAAELFLGLVAEKALAAAAKGKRKTINFADVQKAAQDRRMVEMGLQEIFDHEDTFAEARGEGGDAAEGKEAKEAKRPAKKTKREEAAEGLQPIKSFFQPGTAMAAATGAAASPAANGVLASPTSQAAEKGSCEPAAGATSSEASDQEGSVTASDASPTSSTVQVTTIDMEV